MTPADLGLLHEWLQREHVRRWWDEHATYEEVSEHYLPALQGREPTDHYLILLEGRAIGMIQTYVVADHPDWAGAAQVEEAQATAGVDLFIADEDLTGKGIGTAALRSFTRRVVFTRVKTRACIADPDSRNTASIRAFEKAGFRAVTEFLDPSDGELHTLVRLERPDADPGD
jgi:RimJ/RimL family protein N-acetyltransferase